MASPPCILPDLDGLSWRDDGSLELHLPDAVGWEGGDLVSACRDMVLGRHLEPLIAAIRTVAPVSERLLWGNVASALIGAARALDGETRTAALHAAHEILDDPRLAGAVQQEGAGFRRRSCCLFYRAPTGGYCGDCALTRPGAAVDDQEEDGQHEDDRHEDEAGSV